MTRKKWKELQDKEWNRMYVDMINTNSAILHGPKEWVGYKNAVSNYLKAVDELTEIYNQENHIKE